MAGQESPDESIKSGESPRLTISGRFGGWPLSGLFWNADGQFNEFALILPGGLDGETRLGHGFNRFVNGVHKQSNIFADKQPGRFFHFLAVPVEVLMILIPPGKLSCISINRLSWLPPAAQLRPAASAECGHAVP